MDLTKVYVLDPEACDFLKSADGVLVNLCRGNPPKGSVLITRLPVTSKDKKGSVPTTRSPCPCKDESGSGIVLISESSLVVDVEKHLVLGYPAYVLPLGCTSKEALTVVAWLVKKNFGTFCCRVENGTLVRKLEDAKFFNVAPLHDSCVKYSLKGDTVFFTRRVVVSERNKGFNLESVL